MQPPTNASRNCREQEKGHGQVLINLTSRELKSEVAENSESFSTGCVCGMCLMVVHGQCYTKRNNLMPCTGLACKRQGWRCRTGTRAQQQVQSRA